MTPARLALLTAAALFAAPAAQADMSCDALVEKIKGQLKNQGVDSYALGIVPAEAVRDRTVVGSCDNGTRRIVYRRPDNSNPPVPAGLGDPSKP